MIRFFTKSIALIALVGAFTLISAARSEAAFTMYLCDAAGNCSSAASKTITDGGAGDINPAAGRITAFLSGVGGFDMFDVESGISKPAIGGAGNPELDLTFQAHSAGAAEAWLYLSDNDFTGVGPLSINIGGSTQGVVDTAAWGGQNNNVGTLAGLIASAGPFSGGAFSGVGAGVTVGGVANPYALTLLVHIKHAGAGLTTGDAHLIPEPASMALLGLGLAGLAARRRRAAKVQ